MFLYAVIGNGISMKEKALVSDMLLKSGADIKELNTVRKHLSGVKGGRLAEIAYLAHILSFIVSDVGVIPETPKKADQVFCYVRNEIIASNQKTLLAVRDRATAMGYNAENAPYPIVGEAMTAGKLLAEKALKTMRLLRRKDCINKKVCLISGGETTVVVRGSGKRGRNMELAIEGTSGITFLSTGTDGTDGPTHAAGAFVSGDTMKQARSLGLDPDTYLLTHNSYNFFRKAGGLLITGPTRSNVMDIQIITVEA